MNKFIKGFLATPFVVIGIPLVAIGLIIRYNLDFAVVYLEVIKEALEEMKVYYEEEGGE